MTDPGTNDPDLTQAVQSGVFNAFNTDEFSDSLVYIPFTHEKVHEGAAYDATHEYSSIAGGGSVTATISVPSTINAAHVRAKQWTPSNESIRVELFRNPTIDTAGDPLDATENMNDSEGQPETTITQGATTTDDGSLIKIQGSSGTKDTATINAGAGEELILQPDTDYLIRVTNLSSNNAINYLWYNMFWYET